MKIEVEPGKYVIAVSGGVDSAVLLDLLRMYPGVRLTVAHFDHGIRSDSHLDRQHVHALTKRYGLPFVYDKGELGPGASEAEAREARYRFLHTVQSQTGADAIVTAHHQDDLLETAVINMLRGTGRKGLSSLTSGEGIIRPLLDIPKSEIIDYAKRHGLKWREDSTNNDIDYLRNRVRLEMLPLWSAEEKQRLLDVTKRMRLLNAEIDEAIAASVTGDIARNWFVLLPHMVSREVMAGWLRHHDIRDFDRHTLERLTVAGKTAAPGKAIDIVKGHAMRVSREYLALERAER